MVGVDKMSSVAPWLTRVVPGRCAVSAARIAGLVRKVTLGRVPATTVGRDFAGTATDGAALRP